MAKIFFTPPGYTGTAELTANTGLTVLSQGRWLYSKQGYNDGATFGLSLTHPSPQNGGELQLQATNWPIAVVGNTLTDYVDPDTGDTYPASQCRIQVRGQWTIIRQQNSNSFNGVGVMYGGFTNTDLGNRNYWGTWITGFATYTIQGADVTGGAINTFSGHVFFANMTETTSSDNSNKEYQSNTITRPVWTYTYTKSWEIDV